MQLDAWMASQARAYRTSQCVPDIAQVSTAAACVVPRRGRLLVPRHDRVAVAAVRQRPHVHWLSIAHDRRSHHHTARSWSQRRARSCAVSIYRLVGVGRDPRGRTRTRCHHVRRCSAASSWIRFDSIRFVRTGKHSHAYSQTQSRLWRYAMRCDAMRCGSQGKPITSFGTFIMAIYPGAYVNISESIDDLPAIGKLKVALPFSTHTYIRDSFALCDVFGIRRCRSLICPRVDLLRWSPSQHCAGTRCDAGRHVVFDAARAILPRRSRCRGARGAAGLAVRWPSAGGGHHHVGGRVLGV